MSVDGIVQSYVAATQARTQTAIAARLLKIASGSGANQALALVQQAARAAEQSAAAAVATQGLDVRA